MKLYSFNNGGAKVSYYENGTRIIEGNDYEFPLNVDIRVSTGCSFANNICKDFCHESAVVNGRNADFEALKEKLQNLPPIELAIGCNHLTNELVSFLEWAKSRFICNLTINQGHLRRDIFNLMYCIENDLFKGLGISYRASLNWNVPLEILNYKNTVFHVIIGIDDIHDVIDLRERGVKKILVLGEKLFGYNDILKCHKQWQWNIHKLFNTEVLSFDNLALQQLKMQRFFNSKIWNKFYQGEESLYIDAVNQTFAPSSRSPEIEPWTDIKTYYQEKIKSC